MKRMEGIVTPVVTPFDSKGNVDLEASDKLVDYLIEGGMNGLYPCGTTGEMLKMTVDERMVFSKEVIDHVAGRIPVFIQVGAPSTDEAVTLAKHAVYSGAEGIGVVTPQFFAVTDREMIKYFRTIARAVPNDFPVYLYSIPQCAANDISIEVVKELLSTCKNIAGIKYSYPDFLRLREYFLLGEYYDFDVIIGSDRLDFPGLAMGCKGTVSGCSQCFPKPFAELWQAYKANDFETAQKASIRASELCDIVHGGSNIAWFKAALAIEGVIDTHMRAPALDLEPDEVNKLRLDLEAYRIRYGY